MAILPRRRGGTPTPTPTPTPTFPVPTIGQFGLSTTPVTVAASAGAFGSAVLLGSLTEPVDELLLDIGFSTGGRSLALNVYSGSTGGVGGTLIADRLVVHNVGLGNTPVRLPIRVPAGRVEIAIAANVAGDAYVTPSALKFDVANPATLIEPLTAVNLASLLGTGVTIAPMAVDAASASWVNLGSALANNAHGLILAAQNGGSFGSRTPVGPATIQLSLDGANILASTWAWNSTAALSISHRVFQHRLLSGTQVRGRAFVGAGSLSNINLSLSVIR